MGVSKDQHRVAVTVEAIVFVNGFLVKLVQPGDAIFRAGGEEGGDKAEEGGFVQMEIGDEMVNACEGGGRVDKDIGLGLEGTIGEAGSLGVLLEALEGVFH